MSERLDKEAFHEFMIEWMNSKDKTKIRLEFWQAIEADREAVRAETREEVLKDHFKLGEWLEMTHPINDSDRNIQVLPVFHREALHATLGVRRPAKKRPMIRDELIDQLSELKVSVEIDRPTGYYLSASRDILSKWSRDTLADLSVAFGLPVETAEVDE